MSPVECLVNYLETLQVQGQGHILILPAKGSEECLIYSKHPMTIDWDAHCEVSLCLKYNTDAYMPQVFHFIHFSSSVCVLLCLLKSQSSIFVINSQNNMNIKLTVLQVVNGYMQIYSISIIK